MEKSVKPDEKVKELFCYEVNNVDMYTKGIGVTESGKYYIGLYGLDELYDMGEAIVREKVRRLSLNL